MSLNWKEINLILAELDLSGYQIQKAVQSAYDVMALKLHGKGQSKTLLFCVSPGSCRLHETFMGTPKSGKPLRFAEFLNSRVVNGWIEEAEQIGDNRIVRFIIKQGQVTYRLYARLWSNAANLIVTDENGLILDAMRRLPGRGEVTGGRYVPGEEAGTAEYKTKDREYEIRGFPETGAGGIPRSFNKKIDEWYAEHGGALSLETLREQARRRYEGSMGRLSASLERLKAKEAEFSTPEQLKEYGDIILANMASIKTGDSWLQAHDFYRGGVIRIKLDPHKTPPAQAEDYYEQYRRSKSGLSEVRAEIEAGERELQALKEGLTRLLEETNPLSLQKLLKTRGGASGSGGISGAGRGSPERTGAGAGKKRPGLSFRRKDWLIIVGRDASENDAILRGHVKGGDLWLHVRDYPGSYVFIKQRSGKTFPLDILLDAGNLAIFYSKGRNNGEADLFYTPVKYLRRAKNGPRGLVIPAHEKNLHVKVDKQRLRELEFLKIEK
jgi:predicted ribosome quality control (RQC) complex YloA/Tae2 family protein